MSSVFTYGGFPIIKSNLFPLFILLNENGLILINSSVVASFNISKSIKEFPLIILLSNDGNTGFSFITVSSVSPSKTLSNKLNLATSTA